MTIAKENAEHYVWGENCDGWYLVNLTLELAGQVHHIASQQGLEIPPGAKHQARNEAESSLEFIVISHPTTRGDRTDLLAR